MTIANLHRFHLRKKDAKPPPAIIHVAVAVPDAKTARWLQNRTAVYTPTAWPGRVRLHVIIGNATELNDQLRVDIADLQMVLHEDLDLIYPHELELGWNNE